MSKFVCKYNFDKECIIDDCDECKEHPMYKQGRADGISEYDEYWEMQNNRAYV